MCRNPRFGGENRRFKPVDLNGPDSKFWVWLVGYELRHACCFPATLRDAPQPLREVPGEPGASTRRKLTYMLTSCLETFATEQGVRAARMEAADDPRLDDLVRINGTTDE